MTTKLTFITLLICTIATSQDSISWKKSALILSTEVLVGKTLESNGGFPETSLQKLVIVGIGRNHANNKQSWAQQLNRPTTGISLAIADFGNVENLGYAISLTPFINFKSFRSNHFSINAASGISYITKKYDSISNPKNNAVTTDLTIVLRLFLKYKFYTSEKVDFNLSAGFSHHSNAHAKLLNQGYNSFLIGISADFKNPFNKEIYSEENYNVFKNNNKYSYFGFRSGYGQNVFALAFNNIKDVYTFAVEYGNIYKDTYKIGISLNYKYYEHYYNYIRDNESLVQEGREFESYKSNPTLNASTLNFAVEGELLLNHFGINFQLGYNIYKPGYKIEWRINEGWDNTPKDIPDYWMLGEYGTKYELKQHISTRLGLKYYFLGTSQFQKNNFYLGGFINANLGQADFFEVAFGYSHNFNFRRKN